ncbi:MAG: ribulose-phosphate 3-epimerase [Clostridia bacterium]|nr:ribulose-phosphate 3-epimerase [Clostridia bacterium]
MIKIAPSILAADVLNLERDARRMMDAGADWLHVDVMDAHFVHNLAYSPEVVRRLKQIATVPLDVHLMMDQPGRYLDAFLDAGADVLTIHTEIGGDISAMLDRIRRRGAKAGLALKPGTGISAALPFMDQADLILTMTVEPGFGGQKLNETVLDKIADLRNRGYEGEIEADGGIKETNLSRLIEKGLSVAVMGTALYRAEEPGEMIGRLHQMG